MKIYQWIDKYNEKVCYKIIRQYNIGVNNGKTALYCICFSFWPYYIFRSILVILSFILLKKQSYKNLYRICLNKESIFYAPGQHSILYQKTADLLATWFGFRYLTSGELLPLLHEKKIRNLRIEMPLEKSPLVSIIMPASHQLCYIYNTLCSIQKNSSSSFPFEVIVVDEHITGHLSSFFEKNTSGITYLKKEVNKGYELSSWTLGAYYARGKFICFIDDVIQVSKGWLESLTNMFEHLEIGCVGSKVINRNGLLMHAGGIVYSDVSYQDYGNNANPEHPYYNYIRETDYCSKSAIMFRKEEFIQIQKENTNSVPLALRGINTCLHIKYKIKKKILYQPLSSVIQIVPIPKKEVISNSFPKELWQKELHLNTNSGNIDTDSRRYQEKKTILFIDDVIPAPDQDSGSNRLFKIMKIVQSLGYHVIFAPNDGKKRGNYFDQMINEGFEVIYRFPSRKGMIKVLINTLKYVDATWICKPHNNNLFTFIFKVKQECMWIYDTIDLHYLRMQREAELKNNKRLMQSARITKEVELSIAAKANITIAITDDEKIILNHENLSNVVVIPNIHETVHSKEVVPGFKDRSGLLFIGGYLHNPNIDAAEWLVKQIMPEVWKTDPSIKLTLLGSNPTEKILSYNSEKILVPGYIKDVSTYFNSNRIFVAPLRFGAGMKGKIGQSLEYNLPIVSTNIGIEGMGLIDGQHVLIATDTADFASKIIGLYKSQELWEKLKTNSSQVLENYSPENVASRLKDLFKDLDERKSRMNY